MKASTCALTIALVVATSALADEGLESCKVELRSLTKQLVEAGVERMIKRITDVAAGAAAKADDQEKAAAIVARGRDLAAKHRAEALAALDREFAKMDGIVLDECQRAIIQLKTMDALLQKLR